jgi:hypothetical protein
MTQTQTLKRLRRAQWSGIEKLLRAAYREGFDAGIARAHGQGRRGRPIRADATVAGLVRIVERHFGLDRYGFELRVVHAASGRRVPASSLLSAHRRED